MPNIKSAKKRVLVNAKKTEQNKNIRSEVKTEIKKIYALIKEGKVEEAKALLPNAFKLIDSAAGKNIFHKNNAANKKSKLAKKIEAAAKDTTAPQKEEAKAEEPAPAAAETVAEEVAAEVTEEPVKKPRKPRTKKTEETEAAE